MMQPFVVNRHGRLVFPSDFQPDLDFSVIETEDQLDRLIRRDFETKAPTGTDIMNRVAAGGYASRYELMRDVALNLFWVNRFALTMYDKYPVRWRDVTRSREDMFLPIVAPWLDRDAKVDAVARGYRDLPPTWNETSEDRIFAELFDVLGHRTFDATKLPSIKPTVAEALTDPASLTFTLADYDPRYLFHTYEDIVEVTDEVPELEALQRWSMVLHNQYPWDLSKVRLTAVRDLHDDMIILFVPRSSDVLRFVRRVKAATAAAAGRGGTLVVDRAAAARPVVQARSPIRPYPVLDGAVLFCSCKSSRLIPSASTWLTGQLGMQQAHASVDLIAACAGLPYGLSEAMRLLQEVDRPVLLVCAENFSDKFGTVRPPRMIFGDGASAIVIGPAPIGEPGDIDLLQTYAGGPVTQVNSIIWPNPVFDDNITVYGPEVKELAGRYPAQMIDELTALPDTTGKADSAWDTVELVVPHQANKTMVIDLAAKSGLTADRLYFNIETLGNTSSASIPIAIADAVTDKGINRPMWIFAPDFGCWRGRRLRGSPHRPDHRRSHPPTRPGADHRLPRPTSRPTSPGGRPRQRVGQHRHSVRSMRVSSAAMNPRTPA